MNKPGYSTARISALLCALLACAILLGAATARAAAEPRQVQKFDFGWKFMRMDVPGAEKPDFDDSSWRTLDLPHDWAIEPMTDTERAAQATYAAAAAEKARTMGGRRGGARGANAFTSGTLGARRGGARGANALTSGTFGARRGAAGVAGARGTGARRGGAGGAGVATSGTLGARGGRGRGASAPFTDGVFSSTYASGGAGGYLPGGIGWYRKSFTLAPDQGSNVTIDFEGVYMNSEVWINGHSLGVRPYGYSSFAYDLTPYLNKTGRNVVAVRVNVEQPSSRWYSGAGIYRHVWLTSTSPVHVAHWGTYVTTPEVTADAAKVAIRALVANQAAAAGEVTVRTVILDPKGVEVATGEAKQNAAAGADTTFTQTLSVKNPALWSLETPVLYTAVSEVRQGDKLVDSVRTPFGIRTFEFTKDRGFFMNGKHVQIQGVCMHHDQGYLGAAAYDAAIDRQLEILKSMGCNAIRTSHNPPAPYLLEACDRMGFLVMDETFDEWHGAKRALGYARFFDEWAERDTVALIQRDKNHPSVILWSIGNEIGEQGQPAGVAVTRFLAGICHREDPTRPVTSAMNGAAQADRVGTTREQDVIGINYNPGLYETFKGKYYLFGSETASATSSRGDFLMTLENGQVTIGDVDYAKGQVSAYERFARGGAQLAQYDLYMFRTSPWMAGEFVWTGFDYFGEPAPINGPAASSYYGIIDLCGFPKTRYYIYQSVWSAKPMVHVAPHWTWPGFEGKSIPVDVYTNGDSVELFLNGKSLGEKKVGIDPMFAEWMVPYAPGTLKAVAKKNGKEIATDEQKTAGAPAKLAVSVDRPEIKSDGQDLAYLTVSVLDANGVPCPTADNQVEFAVSGAGKLIGVGNGNAVSHEDFISTHRKLFFGLCLGIVKAGTTPGTIAVEVKAPGLESGKTTIQVAGK